jgi:hypothetical protein
MAASVSSGKTAKRRRKPESVAGALGTSDAGDNAAPSIDTLPNVKLVNTMAKQMAAMAATEPPPGKKRKTCKFLCGSVCGVTKDPLEDDRAAIRWVRDAPDPLAPQSDEGDNDWYCERAFQEGAAESGVRNRAQFQEELGRDKSKLTTFLKRRDGVIERRRNSLLKSGGKPKRRGCRAVRICGPRAHLDLQTRCLLSDRAFLFIVLFYNRR